jgi:hypothetical protein
LRHDETIDGFEIVAWMNEDGCILSHKFKESKTLQELSTKEVPFSGYTIPLYRKKQDERTI